MILYLMSERCYRCYKPLSACLCKYTKEIDCGIKFVLLMHTKEAKRQRTGTGNIAHISLKDSEILVGIDFENNQRLKTLLHDPQYFPVMLCGKKKGFPKTFPVSGFTYTLRRACMDCKKGRSFTDFKREKTPCDNPRFNMVLCPKTY